MNIYQLFKIFSYEEKRILRKLLNEEVINTKDITLWDWCDENRSLMSGRLFNCLKIYCENNRGLKVSEVDTEHLYRNSKNLGRKSIYEFVKLRGY